MHDDLCWMSTLELAAAIRRRVVSPVDAIAAALRQIEMVDPHVNALVTLAADEAMAAARAAEAAVLRGDRLGPLHGVPVGVKDLHQTTGLRTTFGSRLYESYVPNIDSPIVARLKSAGAIVLGKTNTSEFGLIPLTSSSVWGDCCNPWDTTRNAGGSSGGSAVAVASGMTPLATGSDGGGSIRIPASFCGVFGLKPQHGRIPHVHLPRGWESLSHQGVLTRTVRDTALALDVLAGPFAQDRWSLPTADVSFLDACGRDVRGLRLAWSPTLGGLAIEPEVLAVCEQAARRMEELGCVVEDVRLDVEDLCAAQQTIVLCEAAAAHAADREEWQRVIFPATRKLLSNADRLIVRDLCEAHWARERFWEQVCGLFEKFDALLTPTAPITAPANGTLGPRTIGGRDVRSLAWLGYVVPWNMTWQPAATVPVGFAADGLPVGLQVVGRRFDEWTVLQVASAFEAAWPWANNRPPIALSGN